MYDNSKAPISVKPMICSPNQGFMKSPEKQVFAPSFWVLPFAVGKNLIFREKTVKVIK
jgi:hypothetical protein